MSNDGSRRVLRRRGKYTRVVRSRWGWPSSPRFTSNGVTRSFVFGIRNRHRWTTIKTSLCLTFSTSRWYRKWIWSLLHRFSYPWVRLWTVSLSRYRLSGWCRYNSFLCPTLGLDGNSRILISLWSSHVTGGPFRRPWLLVKVRLFRLHTRLVSFRYPRLTELHKGCNTSLTNCTWVFSHKKSKC